MNIAVLDETRVPRQYPLPLPAPLHIPVPAQVIRGHSIAHEDLSPWALADKAAAWIDCRALFFPTTEQASWLFRVSRQLIRKERRPDYSPALGLLAYGWVNSSESERATIILNRNVCAGRQRCRPSGAGRCGRYRGASYRLDTDALFIGYMLSAEFGFHVALGWGQPACALDPYIEFRHHTNDGTIKSGDREKGFYSLDGALRYFCEDGIDTARKTDMRDRILQGPPFTNTEREAILKYCEDDTRSLARLVPHIVPRIRSLPHAMLRAKYAWPIAHHERRGIPVDMSTLDRTRSHWNGIKVDLVNEKNPAYGVYEIVDGVPHWRKKLFANYVHRNRMAWPTLASGVFDESDEAFKDMEGRYPQVRELRQLRNTVSKLKLHELQVGADGRNRTLLGMYGTKTARNAPSSAGYIFGPAKWVRFLISPPPGRVLIHRDFSQQEVHVAAVKSGDGALLQACQAGDVYIGIAQQLGLAPEGATKATHKPVRQLFKSVVLGILYGLGPRTLAMQTGVSLFEAAELLARLRARFRVFEDFVQCTLDHAGLLLEISTPFGWTMQCPPGINPRTVRNFPIQSTAAEILHVACILAERRNIHTVATVHDALMAETDSGCVDETDAALCNAMRDASSIVLRGYELPTDKQIIRPGERFHDDGGAEMWGTVERLLAKLEARSA